MLHLDARIEALTPRRSAIVCAPPAIAAIAHEALAVTIVRCERLGEALRHPVLPAAIVLDIDHVTELSAIEALCAVRRRAPGALRIAVVTPGSTAERDLRAFEDDDDVIVERAGLRGALAASAARLAPEQLAWWIVDASAFFASVPAVHHDPLLARIRATVRHELARFEPAARLAHETRHEATLAFGVARIADAVFERFLRQLRVHLDVGLSHLVPGRPVQLPRCLVQRR